MVKDPQDTQGQSEYISAYNSAERLIYAPILFDSTQILNRQADEYTNYYSLYSKVIGDHGKVILDDIQFWAQKSSGKKIIIEHTPLTYQQLAKDNPDWLDSKVKAFYEL